jgi:very-short-patch-repair endonuclease
MTVAGLKVVPQGHVPGVGFVDLLDRVLGIVFEAESFEHHWTKAGLQRDVDRYTAAARLGLVVVRFSWADVMFRPDDVRAAIEDVVRRQRIASSSRPRSTTRRWATSWIRSRWAPPSAANTP